MQFGQMTCGNRASGLEPPHEVDAQGQQRQRGPFDVIDFEDALTDPRGEGVLHLLFDFSSVSGDLGAMLRGERMELVLHDPTHATVVSVPLAECMDHRTDLFDGFLVGF